MPGGTRESYSASAFWASGTGLSPSLAGLPRPSYPFAFFLASVPLNTNSYPPLPIPCSDCSLLSHRMFGLFPVRSPLLGKSLLISSPRSTEMFQFPRFPAYTIVSSSRAASSPAAVPPIRVPPDRRFCLPLPGAFRCLPRLLQLLAPRASTVCLSFLTSFHCAIFQGAVSWSLITKQYEKGSYPVFQCACAPSTSGLLPRKEVISRTFRYGYLVTTSPQSPTPPSTAASFTGSPTGFGCCWLSWCDGRCVQGPRSVFLRGMLIRDY